MIKLMSILQGVIHFNYILSGKVLGEVSKEFNVNIEDLLETGGNCVSFKIRNDCKIIGSRS